MPTEMNEMLEQQLRGLSLPDAVSWWPLAIGWWLLIVLLTLLVSAVIYKLLKHRKQNKYRKVASSELRLAFQEWQKSTNASTYLGASNSILKRVIRGLGNTTSANKSGNDWANLIQSHAIQTLSPKALKALTEDCYKANPEVDVKQLHQQLLVWLRTHKRQSEVSHA